MADRRQILKAGLAASAAPLGAFAFTDAEAHAAGPVHRAVYDERYASSRAFGRMAALKGWPLAPIRGDITQLWFHDLALEWKRRPAAVAGLTGADSLFCLERLAWDAGLRVLWRSRDASSGLVAWVIGPRPAAKSQPGRRA